MADRIDQPHQPTAGRPALRLLAEHAEALVQKCIEMALDGDKTCLALLVGRILPSKLALEDDALARGEPAGAAATAARLVELNAELDAAYGPVN